MAEVLLTSTLEARGEHRWPVDAPLRRDPLLCNRLAAEARATARIVAACAVRPVVTLFELHEELLASEGVEHFADIGIGPSIYHVDAARRLFKCSPAGENVAQIPPPFRGTDFILFFSSDSEARELLASGADAGAIADAFARHVGYNRGRSIGLHITNLPLLELAVREQMAAWELTKKRSMACLSGSDDFVVDAAFQASLQLSAFNPFSDACRKVRRTGANMALTVGFDITVAHGAVSVLVVRGTLLQAPPPADAPTPPSAPPQQGGQPNPSDAIFPAAALRKRGRIVSAATRVPTVDRTETVTSLDTVPSGAELSASDPFGCRGLSVTRYGKIMRGSADWHRRLAWVPTPLPIVDTAQSLVIERDVIVSSCNDLARLLSEYDPAVITPHLQAKVDLYDDHDQFLGSMLMPSSVALDLYETTVPIARNGATPSLSEVHDALVKLMNAVTDGSSTPIIGTQFPLPSPVSLKPLLQYASARFAKWIHLRIVPGSKGDSTSYHMVAIRHDDEKQFRKLLECFYAFVARVIASASEPLNLAASDVPLLLPLDTLLLPLTSLAPIKDSEMPLKNVGILLDWADLVRSTDDGPQLAPSLWYLRRSQVLSPSLVELLEFWASVPSPSTLHPASFARKISVALAVVRDVVCDASSSVCRALSRGSTFGTDKLSPRDVCRELQAAIIDVLTTTQSSAEASDGVEPRPGALLVPCSEGYFLESSENVFWGVGTLASRFANALAERVTRRGGVWILLPTAACEVTSIARKLERAFGIIPLADAVETTVRYSQLAHNEAAGVTAQFRACLPWVQCLLQTHFPKYFHDISADIGHRLATLVIAVSSNDLCASHVLRRLSDSAADDVVLKSEELRGIYVPSSNVLYLNRTATSAHVMEPYFSTVLFGECGHRAADAVKLLLRATLGAPSIEKAVDELAGSHGPLFRVLLSRMRSGKGDTDGLWDIPHKTLQRAHGTFPPGADIYVSVPSLPVQRFEAPPRPVKRRLEETGTPTMLLLKEQPLSSCRGRYAAPRPPPVAGESFMVTVGATSGTPRLLFGKDEEERANGDDEDKGGVRVIEGASEAAQLFKTSSQANGSSTDDFISFGFGVRPTGDASVFDADAIQNSDAVKYSRPAEEYVAFLLQRQRPSSPNERYVVQWMNKDEERGSPYDILSYVEDTRTGARSQVTYVEVKATLTTSRRSFELSLRELLFAAEKGHDYVIYRVFNARALLGQGAAAVKVVELRDPISLWRRGSVSIKATIEVSFAAS